MSKVIVFYDFEIDGEVAILRARNGQEVDRIYLDNLVKNFIDEQIKNGLYKEDKHK